jgi:hypothetical protein
MLPLSVEVKKYKGALMCVLLSVYSRCTGLRCYPPADGSQKLVMEVVSRLGYADDNEVSVETISQVHV